MKISNFSFVPESPRWLVAEGRIDEALVILKDGAKKNKKSLPPDDELRELLAGKKNTKINLKMSEMCPENMSIQSLFPKFHL